MPDFADYLDAAKSATGAGSDRALALQMGLSASYLSMLRRGENLPNDNILLGLARLAGMDEALALIDLNIWRSKGEVTVAYYHMRERLARDLHRQRAAAE